MPCPAPLMMQQSGSAGVDPERGTTTMLAMKVDATREKMQEAPKAPIVDHKHLSYLGDDASDESEYSEVVSEEEEEEAGDGNACCTRTPVGGGTGEEISSGPSSDCDASDDDDDDDDGVASSAETALTEKERRLLRLCPTATPAECQRFSAEHASSKDASRKLAAYLEWRDIHGIVGAGAGAGAAGEETDEDVWNRCARAALMAERNKGRSIGAGGGGGGGGEVEEDNNDGTESVLLPRIVRVLGSGDEGSDNGGHGGPMSPSIRDIDDKRTLHVLIAMVDNQIAPPSTYALCTALYIDAISDNSSLETRTIVVDVRSGKGWANPTPLTIVPFVKILSAMTANHFPGRLHRCVVFPMPKAAVYIWKIMKGVLDKRHTAKIRLVAGPARGRSPVPEKKLREYFSHEAIEIMENERLASFR